jgi:polyisoprenoid-binding protein YceI
MRIFRQAAVVAFICSMGAVAELRAADRPIDVSRSTLTVFVYKSGLFSAFADNHTIRAPIASGSMSEEMPYHVQLSVRAAELKVLDPDLGESRRAEVQAKMLGPEVLDTSKHSEITFASTRIDAAGPDKWTVTGNLTIRGQMRVVTFPAIRKDRTYRGDVLVKQKDFGIEPIKVAGGTVKVKDELKIQFEIVAQGAP